MTIADGETIRAEDIRLDGYEMTDPLPLTWYVGAYTGTLHEEDSFPGGYVIVNGKKWWDNYTVDYPAVVTVAANGKTTITSTFGGKKSQTQTLTVKAVPNRETAVATGTFRMNGYMFYLTTTLVRATGEMSVECNAADKYSSISVTGTLLK